ncbi:MAG: hypothetical protein Q9227_006019 [Pyrenula ochraceoflavens]
MGFTNRARICSPRSLAFGALLLVCFYVFHARRPAPAPPPLPGTYQYFAETDFHSETHLFGGVSHADSRFAPAKAPSIDETQRSLRALCESYAAIMKELSVETWLSHGVLLGWYWNQKLLPWDTDLDVQTSYEGLQTLTSHNMSKYQYPPASESARTYLLDVNPHSAIISTKDVANKIDARWIDTTNGKFIDITVVHPVRTGNHARSPVEDGSMFCKDGHRYNQLDIYPLLSTTFEGVGVNVPSQSKKILQEEYGKKALTKERFHWHHFDRASKTWLPD